MEARDHQRDGKDIRKALYEPSLEGNVIGLIELLKEDPLVLERTITSSSGTPLHIAAMLGHIKFAIEILSRKPDLASEFNSDGYSPLHLAAARKNIDMVRELLRAEPDVCLSTDSNGRTPLHLAAKKGRIEVMKELFLCRPEAIQVVLDGGETILHLCVKHSRLEALKLLLQWGVNSHDQGSSGDHHVSVNSKDDDGNTILHLAVAKKHIQIIKLLLLSNIAHDVEMNAMNQNGLTALDILTQSTVRDLKDLEIGEVIRGAGGLRAKDIISTANNVNGEHAVRISRDDPVRTQSTSASSIWGKRLGEHEKWLEKQLNTVMVVASLIASIAFQAVLNPPSEFHKIKEESNQPVIRDDTARTVNGGFAAIGSTGYLLSTDYDGFNTYMKANTIGFLGSMIVTILAMSGLPLNRRTFIWVLMFIMWASITAMGYSYIMVIDSLFTGQAAAELNCTLFLTWIVLMFCILLMHTTRFLLRVIKKTGRNKRIFLMCWCPIVLACFLCLLYLQPCRGRRRAFPI